MSAHAGTHADAPLHVESAWGASETLPTRVFVGGVVVIALPERTASDSLITRALLERLLAPQPRHRLDASNPFDIAPVEIAAVDIVPDATSPSGLVPAGIVPQRLLCCTGRSVAHGEFPSEWPVLDEAAAAWLVQSGLILWGTDAPSVDARASTSLPVHHCLFEGGAYVLENLALDGVAPGRYELLAQPLSVQGADAAPVRALLRRW